MTRKKKNPLSPERREKGGFAAIPHCLLESPLFIGLSAHAVKLMMDLASQYKGFNNGDMTIAWTIMEIRGWKSRETLNNARKELLYKGLIEITRMGDRRRPHLYALTFFAIDECNGKLDVKPTERPTSAWRLHNPLPPLLQKQNRVTPGVSKGADITRPACNPNQAEAQYDTPTVSNQQIPEMI